MVLKRILVTTLSALGLGALVAGTASGQDGAGEGNIPAPDIFDPQITCTMNVPTARQTPMPTVVPRGGKTSPLDDLINGLGMGTYQLTTANIDTLITDTDANAAALLTLNTNLGYVIPADGSNCGLGAGTVGTPIDPFTATGTGSEGPIPFDVAKGYSDLLEQFKRVYGDPDSLTSTGTNGELEAAKKAQRELPADATPAQRTAAQDRVDTADAAHKRAMAAYNRVSAGLSESAAGQSPIYKAGVAEWMAKAAVTKSIDDYNKAVMKAYGTDGGMTAAAGGEKGELDNMLYSSNGASDGTSKYVPLGADDATTGSQLVTGSSPVVTIAANGRATVNQAMIVDYVNRNLDQAAATVDDDGVTTITVSNFDAEGRLVVPMIDTDTGTDGVQLGPEVSPTVLTVTAIRTVAENHEAAAKALEKLRDENVNPVNQEVFNEAARRARLEANYYNDVYRRMLTDSVDVRTEDQKDPEHDDYEAAPITIASRQADYIQASNDRVLAQADLKSKVETREAATTRVRQAFNSPQDFYQQLVDRRTALKAAADKAVTDAQANGGTASKDLLDDQETADTALTTAETEQDKLNKLFEDEADPTVALLNELVKNDGDDGQALVDAISSNYDTANQAKTKADEVAESVSGLTGDEGAVSMNTQRSMQNAEDIEALDGRVTKNEGDIASNTMMIDENRGMIMTNTENIATNATNIAANTSHIMENRGMIETNAGDIMTNAGHIMENRGMIETNTAGISSNADAIAANMNSIGSNASAISDNRNMIGELSDDLDVVRAGVAASMALAGMPAINGRGISIGVGSFDGESAFAVGFQVQTEMASFKVGVTSASGATGASAGVGFQF